MFSKIFKYIFRAVLISCLIVTAIFCLLFTIFTYLGQLSYSDGSSLVALLNTLYQLPEIMYSLLPACTMVGALMALSQLANNSEIVVLRSIGMSTTKISRGVVAVGIIFVIFGIILGGYISPITQKYLNNGIISTSSNIWLKTDEGFTNIKNINIAKKEVYGVRKFVFAGDDDLKEVRYAQHAVYSDDYHAEAFNISKVTFPKNADDNLIVTKQQDHDEWSDALPISIAQTLIADDSNYLNLNDLVTYVSDSDSSSHKDDIYLKFWQELFQPISLIVLMLISVPLSVGSNRSSSLIIKLLIGAFIGFVFFIANQALGPLALLLGWPPILGAASPTIVATILLIILFKKSKEQ
jgi:lipopolysaccharide export system permease protein